MELSTLFVDPDGKLYHMKGLLARRIAPTYEHFNRPVMSLQTNRTVNTTKHRVKSLMPNYRDSFMHLDYVGVQMNYSNYNIIYI